MADRHINIFQYMEYEAHFVRHVFDMLNALYANTPVNTQLHEVGLHAVYTATDLQEDRTQPTNNRSAIVCI